MPRAWFCIPTACPIDEANRCFLAWRERGYGTAAFVDAGKPLPDADLVVAGEYCGYPKAANLLCRRVCDEHQEVIACVCGGNDIFPDQNHTADELAEQFAFHFPDLFGVMSCTGDGFSANDCCIVSPWFGREYVRRAYGGVGPWCEAYSHYWVDREGFDVAQKLGVLWLRPDLSQFHDHWSRKGTPPPEHIQKWRALNRKGHELYQRRKAENFPGSEPLGASDECHGEFCRPMP